MKKPHKRKFTGQKKMVFHVEYGMNKQVDIIVEYLKISGASIDEEGYNPNSEYTPIHAVLCKKGDDCVLMHFPYKKTQRTILQIEGVLDD